MKTTIDGAGRVVIPKAIRERAGLKSGMELDIHCVEGAIEIVPQPSQGSFVKKGSVLVWRPDSGAGTADVVELVERERERRLDEIARRAGL